jgi:hypothetical protein
MTSTAEIGNLRVRLGIDSAEFANGVRSVQGSLSSLGSSLKAFATGAAAITLFNQAVTALHSVADMGDVAEAIGVTAEQLQVYNRMALASGASSEIMMRGLQSIAEQSTDAKSKLADLFSANGLTLAGKEMNQVILDFMNLLQAAKTPAEQLAIATGVLGDKVGRQLVESMRTGASGWHDSFIQMKDDGWYLADEQVKAAQAIETKYNEVIAKIEAAWQGMVVRITQAFARGGGYAVSPELRAKFQEFQDARDGVTTAPGKGDYLDMKGDLPANINTGNGYGINSPTSNPFGMPSATKEKIQKAAKEYIPKDSLDDIYGYGEAFQTLWDDMEQGIPTINAVTESLQNMADMMAQNLSDAIVGLISGTMSVKEAFRSMAQSIGQQLEQLAAQIIKSQIFKLISMLAGSATGGMGFSFGGMSFGGFYADGGNLGSGKWGIAGENGPEIIHGPASITPMDKAGRGSPQMNVTVINNSSAQINTRKNSRGELEVLVEEIMSDKALRGGNKFDAAMQRGYGLRRAGR